MQLVTLDFETYFDAQYSLKRKEYNTSGYIRDPKFKVQCVAIKVNDGPTQWYPGQEVAHVLAGIAWRDSAVLAHNAAFDGHILSHHYGAVPAFYYDTLSMARALHSNTIRANLDAVARHYAVGNKLPDVLEQTKGVRELPDDLLVRLGAYCVVDVDLCYHIFGRMLPAFCDAELRLIDLTVRMFADPILEVDLARAEVALKNELAERASVIARAGVEPAILRSNEKFTAALEERGVVVPQKISPRTGKRAPALAKQDLDFQELRDHPEEAVRHLVEARIAAKSTIDETRAKRLIDAGKSGKLPVLLNYFGAHTSRWSAGNKMNMQNLRRNGELRKSIVAPAGHVIVSCDSAQIEARTLAWLADHDTLLDLYRAKADVYRHQAAVIYNKPVSEISDAERFVGKVCVLGLGYGMGVHKFQYTLAAGTMGPPVRLPIEQCTQVVAGYRLTNFKIPQLWELMERILEQLDLKQTGSYKCLEYKNNKIYLPHAIILQYPNLIGDWDDTEQRYRGFQFTSSDGQPKKIYGGLLTENVVQALARIIVAAQMLTIAERYRVVMMTHDEVVCVVPCDNEAAACDDMVRIMSTPPSWCADLPLSAEVTSGQHYS